MIIVTLYNHKGGVAKTTTTFNLAHLMASYERRVLIVDADPQCNMTELCLGELIAELDRSSLESGDVKQLPGSSLLDILQPRISGDEGRVDITRIVPASIVDPTLDLIRGDVSLSIIEDKLAAAHEHRTTTDAHQLKTYIAIGDFLERYAKKQDYDYVLVDLGPSSGALTRSFFLACDAFFIPVTADRFCVQAMATMGTIIERWIREHREARYSLEQQPLPVRYGEPTFLGLIGQLFKKRGDVPQIGYKFWLDRIPTAAQDNILEKLDALGGDSLTFGLDSNSLLAASIPHFEHLAPLMQAAGKPIFGITQADTALVSPSGRQLTGKVWTEAETKIVEFGQMFDRIFRRIQEFEAR